MRAHTERALAVADVALLVIDAREGVTEADRHFGGWLRRSGKPVVLVANKTEGRATLPGVGEAYQLGLGDPVPISAEHGEGLAELYERLRPFAVGGSVDAAPTEHGKPLQLAIVGRPNVGKSTLANRLIGEDRLLTGPEAGITRDAIAVDLDWCGHSFRVYDTAGLRRRAKVEHKLEELSVADALRAIRFAEVVVVLIDAEHPFEKQDLLIVDLVEREGRALVVAVSKWDLAERRPGAITRLRSETDHLLPQVKGAPVVAVSGFTGDGVDRLMQAILDAHAVWNRRVPTNALNRWFGEALAAHPPPAAAGRALKLNYMTQVKTRPPTFVVFGSRAGAVPDAYRRYLVNGLRETFDLPGTPVRLSLREKANPYARRKS